MLSLEGLSCGDAFGERFFLPRDEARSRIARRTLPPGSWSFTDDTMMAISIVETLRVDEQIVESRLAAHFANLYDETRGYGAAMHGLLTRIRRRGGEFWGEEAGALFAGRGSFGNGAAMRVATLGAYFADDLGRVVDEAERSARVTHAHPEAAAGAIAVAVAAALAWRSRELQRAPRPAECLEAIWSVVPASAVRTGLERAMDLKAEATVEEAAAVLGNGSHVSAADTVPFALWSASRWPGDYEEAMWQTVSALGDRDTTCAMVGGVVSLRVGLDGIPKEWRRRREPLEAVIQAGSEPG